MLRILRHLAYEGPRHAGLAAVCWCTTGEDLGFGLDSGYGHLIANEHPRCPIHTSAGHALQASHRPTILTDRCAPPDTTPTTTAPAADSTPARLTEWTSGSGLPMHSPSRHDTRTRPGP